MAENSENIEAKLCAYVEGDLDEQGRAEIERHLEVHPNHRRLLSELAATRDLLRYLPRENAPADLAETFNAQLERSALLDGPAADPTAPTLHANLLPRLVALAAIVILGAGLGVVVYFGLPRGTSSATYSRNIRPGVNPTDAESIATTETTTRPETARAERLMKDGGGESEVALSPKLKAAEPTRASKAGKADKYAAKPIAIAGSTIAGAEPVYVYVCATDPAAAAREVTQQLSANNISWQPADASAQVGQQQAPFSSQVVTNTSGAFADPARIELDNALKKRQQLQVQQAEVAAPQEPNLPESVASAESNEKLRAGNKAGQEQVAVANAPSAAAAPAPAPLPAPSPQVNRTAKELEASQQQTQKRDQQKPQASPQPQQQAAQTTTLAQLQQDTQRPSAGDVACYRAKMTREQVLNLGIALNSPAQQVELIADDRQLQHANALFQQGQQGQQFARRSPASPLAERSAVSDLRDRGARANGAPVTQPADNVQPQVIARGGEVGAPSVAGKVAAGTASKTAEEAKINSKAMAAAPQRQSGIAMKVGPGDHAKGGSGGGNANADQQQQQQQQIAGASAAAEAAPSTAPAVAPPQVAAPGAALKQSDRNMRYGGDQQAKFEDKIVPHTRLRVIVDELASPDTNKMSDADVADDGTIALPRLEQRVRVEGLTRPQAEQAIHDAYKAAKVVDDPHVSIEELTPAPMQQHLQQRAEPPIALAQRSAPRDAANLAQQAPAGQVAASQPVAEAESERAPQTPPTSGPAVAPADQPLDVVILVQRSTTAATEPAMDAAQSAHESAAAQPNQAAGNEPPADAAPNANAPAAPAPAPPAPPPAPPELPAK